MKIFPVFLYLKEVICTCCINSLGRVFYRTYGFPHHCTSSPKHKLWHAEVLNNNKYLLTEFPLKGDFEEDTGMAIQASKVSELDRRMPPSGKAVLRLCLKTASWARPGSENLPWASVSSDLCLQEKAFKLQNSWEAVTLKGREKALFLLRMKNSKVPLDVGIKILLDIRQ